MGFPYRTVYGDSQYGIQYSLEVPLL
jgi:hypothetical protein